ncbi:diaminohydroxyphosphoribosylaminopyrimidine deaminase [Breznakibacter xylanolyticus]|uniref:Riboflavin biosynthesis protein RibD n=1 Tax=Breznakibacter xylanolyticus TaxID=990 RepID=A0A2W7NGB6_9BACT|nr:bifunctional diaminohydroxyphosphoribosylaminopyrimidine deaminase/5-amino-6-(5-phosphoribosylamino)uracil reductase RibD [Breznakibacter xylanolyticus]PZX19268.1 diaminohydroxyphosphoribosylaminopyrimidine deaminase [Breznakibacter xylanolyticus]
MNQQHTDERFMARCLQLAAMGQGHTYPNPMVGAVVVHRGKIIGEGYHCKAGEAHAEVNAINSVKDAALLRESTIYVSLEPCAHFGKTPPCSLLIIEKKIPRVVVGCIDSFSEVAGRGVAMLQQAGVSVTVGVLEDECRYINRRFFTFFEKKRPFVMLKWAQTLDGLMDIERTSTHWGEPTWITNSQALREVHRMRAREQAILVGYRTALKDNPSLTVRHWVGNQPLRVVIDREASLPPSLNLFDHRHPTLLVTAKKVASSENIRVLTIDFNQHFLTTLLRQLAAMGIQSLIVEGGAATLQRFIDAGLWDEAHVYVGDKWFGRGVKAPVLNAIQLSSQTWGDSRLFIFKPQG